MTAILALESGRLDETVTVSRLAASAPRMKMNLTTGEKIKLNDLLAALMLESANDAAVAIAEHLGGSVENFCALMTEKAREIGAKDTLYETPNGLDKGDHHSTAYDLALIARYALNVPGFIGLTNTTMVNISSDKRGYTVINKNRLLHEYSGANGVKTGFTSKAGHCFVGAAKREDMQLISVVLASGWGDQGKRMKWVDTKEVLNYGFNSFEYETVVLSGAQAGHVPVTRSRTETIHYVYDETVTLPLNQNEKERVSIEKSVPDDIRAPIQLNETVGSAKVYINDELFCEIKLTAADYAIRHDLKTSLEKIINGWLGQGTNKKVKVVLPEF
jgi:D-alanyl-D-alanine carboxypeptidase (penicillin-binding protein 5/6)